MEIPAGVLARAMFATRGRRQRCPERLPGIKYGVGKLKRMQEVARERRHRCW